MLVTDADVSNVHTFKCSIQEDVYEGHWMVVYDKKKFGTEAMSKRELYFTSGSPPCWSVMLALEVKGLNYTPVRLYNSKSEQNAPKLLAVNPRGEVPVLMDGNGSGDGATFCETLSILTYLDAAYPEPLLFGDTSTETAQMWQSISECNSNLTDQVGDISRPLFQNKGANLLIR